MRENKVNKSLEEKTGKPIIFRMNKDIRIAFFDIDWTLYDHNGKRWSERSLEAIKKLHSKGVKIFICSARPFNSLDIFGVFNLGVEWDGYISSAGACAFIDGKFIRKTLMDPNRVRVFLDLAKERGLTAEIVSPLTRKLAFPTNSISDEYYARFVECVPPIAPYEDEEVTGLNLFSHEDEDELFKKEFPDFVFYRYAPFAVDVSGEIHEKGDAIDCVLSHYGFSKEQGIGFGDDYQDISMAEHLGTFVAMENGRDEVKQVASFVAPGVSEDGVYWGLKHYGLAD